MKTPSPLLGILLGVVWLATCAYFIQGCTKKVAPPPVAITEATPDTVPPPRIFIPRARDVRPALPPRFFAQVFFAFDIDTLNEAGLKAIERAGAFLAAHPGYTLSIDGYADTTGRDGYNDTLSQRRANEAWRAIVAIASPRIGAALGHGEVGGDPARARRATIRIIP